VNFIIWRITFTCLSCLGRPDIPVQTTTAHPENAFESIRVNRDSDSNEIDESDLQHEKHSEQRISTLRGIMID
jgi:hypothetical protein